MAKKKVVTVHEHPMHVSVSKKNPTGLTIRDQHLRRLKGTYLDREEVDITFKNYDRKNLVYPASKKLEFKNSDKYDEIIAIWTDYFNKKFNADPPLDPDIVKALIASESYPYGRKMAIQKKKISRRKVGTYRRRRRDHLRI